MNEAQNQYEGRPNYNSFSFRDILDRVWEYKSKAEWKRCFKNLEKKYPNYDNFISYSYRGSFLVQMEFDAREYE